MKSVFLLSCLLFLFGGVRTEGAPFVWPTPSTAFAEGRPFTDWVQATASGIPESGLFGCVRNGGRRFHEGIDIAPVLPRRRGEATDPIFAFADGRVAYINAAAGNSGYGRYVVLEHPQMQPAVYSLYSHLARIDDSLAEGTVVAAGDTLGIMGRSAGGYVIPRERAHLHFEIGLRLSDSFQDWFDRQGFGSPNTHGLWNGMNLVGLDPLDFLTRARDGEVATIGEYFAGLPAGVILRVSTDSIPDLVMRYPFLLQGSVPTEGLAGWEVVLTGWGLPLRLIPLRAEDLGEAAAPGSITISAVDPEELGTYACRQIVSLQGDQATLGRGGVRILQLIFNFS
jgi:hypothetical protein